jgi:transcriptional regulator of nitric oxide reductase
MKNLILLILCLALTSLACLSTGQVSAFPTASPVATESLVPAAELVQEQDVISPSPQPSPSGRGSEAEMCAVISAVQALHLRSAANPTSHVMAFMRSGEVVWLISRSNADWWLVRRGRLVGYARSKYLAEMECE